MKFLKYYRQVNEQGYCCICATRTDMKVTNTGEYLCIGFGMGGLNPGSDAFCHNLYDKRKIRDGKNIGE